MSPDFPFRQALLLDSGFEEDDTVGYEVHFDPDEPRDIEEAWQEELQGMSVEELDESSPRLQMLMQRYEELKHRHPDAKALIFSQYRTFLDIVAERMSREKIHAFRYDGTVPPGIRDGVLDSFRQDANHGPLLITAGAGSLGLHLTCARIVIRCETWFTKEQERQAVGRAHRQGQRERVIYVKLMASDSEIDLKMAGLVKTKYKIATEIMGGVVRPVGERARVERRMISNETIQEFFVLPS